jgi:hypothetical protein
MSERTMGFNFYPCSSFIHQLSGSLRSLCYKQVHCLTPANLILQTFEVSIKSTVPPAIQVSSNAATELKITAHKHNQTYLSMGKRTKTTKITKTTIVVTTPTTPTIINHSVPAPTSKHACCVCGQLLQWRILGYWYCWFCHCPMHLTD